MRMWMVDPSIMCMKHLLGEHVETHMFLGTLKKKISVKGYLEKNLFEPRSLKDRHEKLVQEMLKRGMNHQSPLLVSSEDYDYLTIDHIYKRIDKVSAKSELLSRCPTCNVNFFKKERKEDKARCFSMLYGGTGI